MIKKGNDRNLFLLLLGRMTSDTGTSIQMIVMPLYIIDIGGSVTTVGLYSFLSIAAVLVYPLASVFGDIINRKTIMVCSNYNTAYNNTFNATSGLKRAS